MAIFELEAVNYVEHYGLSRRLTEEGRFEQGERAGDWRFWDERGELDVERSGRYEGGRRTGGL